MKLLAAGVACLAALTIDYTITRRLDMTYDGKTTVVKEGQDVELPCKHAEGKTHRIKLQRAKAYEFKGLGVRFDFDSTMNLTVESSGSVTGARIMHSTGSFALVQKFAATPDGDP